MKGNPSLNFLTRSSHLTKTKVNPRFPLRKSVRNALYIQQKEQKFNFDIQQVDRLLKGNFIKAPKVKSPQEMLKWLESV